MKEEILRFSYDKLLHSADFHESIKQLNIDVDLLGARRFFAACKPIRGMLLYFSAEDIEKGLVQIQNNQLILSNVPLTCDAVTKYSNKPIKSAMAYLISCNPESYQEYGTYEMNYHFIENACIDLVRNMIMQNFKSLTESECEKGDTIWFTKGFGPGYYGMPVEEGKKILNVLHGERIGVSYKGDMMYPLKSTLGVMFSYEAETPVEENPCTYCKAGNRNCIFCGESKNRIPLNKMEK